MKKMLKKRLAVLIVLVLVVQASFMTPFFTFKTAIQAQEGTGTEQIDTFEADSYVAGVEESEEVLEEDAVVPAVQDEITEGQETVITFSEPDSAEEEIQENYLTRGPPEESRSLLKASRDTYLAFTSDVHNQSNNIAADRLGLWIDAVQNIYGSIDYMGFCGDMAEYAAGSNYWTYTQAVIDEVSKRGIDACYTTGNHEYDHRHSSSNYYHELNSTTQYFTVDAVPSNLPEDANYSLYALGSMSGSQGYTSAQINHLTTFLANADADKPIIVFAHFPLHYAVQSNGYGRSTSNAGGVIDALNTAANSGKTVIFLWGHNHTLANSGEDNYDQIFLPGDRIRYDSSTYRNIQFYYAAAGCMSDYSYSQGSAAVKGKGLVIQVRADGGIGFAYYDEKGKDVTEPGKYPQIILESVAVTDLTINEPASTSVEVGRKLKLTATILPSDATCKDIVWTSSDTSVATVDSNGTVLGISEGEATISAIVQDTVSGIVFEDSITVTVTERTSQEQYYIIKIDNYALSSQPSSEMQSNTSGYIYHGLQAVAYDETASAMQDNLWTLEEAEDYTNGYYIRSYRGEYLSGTYVRNGNGYAGTLNVGDEQDIWIPGSDIDEWQEKGCYLKSLNASNNPRPADIYLTTRTGNQNIDFFTVGSSSSYKTCQLIEVTGIAEPVAVSGITVDPASIELEAGKTAGITANILPENATDKTFTWGSSNESIATVSNDGRVTGIAEGEAYITATTNDGGFSASCCVTVIPRPELSIGYVIRIGDFALSANPSSDVLVNNTNYRYRGLTGVPYDGTTEPSKDILWFLEPVEGGYFIMDQEGQYLNAVYTPTTYPTGCNAILKLDDTPDIWTLEGSFEDWTLAGSTLKSMNAGKYLTHEEGTNTAPKNLFTVRSNGESSTAAGPFDVHEEHVWGDPEWSWADDFSAATATFTCSNGLSHTETVSAEITKDETAVGVIPYIATVEFDGKVFTDKKIADLTVNNALELKDGIVLHLYIRDIPKGTEPSDYTIKYNDVYGKLYTEVLTSREENRFSVNVDSPEMTQKVNVEIDYKGTTVYSNYTSVQRYCDKVIETEDSKELVELCYAILHYGTSAQKLFQKHLEDLANANHPELPYELQDVPETLTKKAIDETKISYATMALNLRYQTEMFFYFTPANGVSAEDIAAEVWKNSVKAGEDEFACSVEADGRLLVKVKHIKAIDLADTITVKLSADGKQIGEVSASPTAYLYLAGNVAELADFSSAMYNYYLKTVQYFAK